MIISRVNSRSSLYYCGIISVLCSYIIIMCCMYMHIYLHIWLCVHVLSVRVYMNVCVCMCVIRILIIYACPYITCILMFGINM